MANKSNICGYAITRHTLDYDGAKLPSTNVYSIGIGSIMDDKFNPEFSYYSSQETLDSEYDNIQNDEKNAKLSMYDKDKVYSLIDKYLNDKSINAIAVTMPKTSAYYGHIEGNGKTLLDIKNEIDEAFSYCDSEVLTKEKFKYSVPLTSLSISSIPSIIKGNSYQCKCTLVPVGSTQFSLKWSIIDGNDYATINSSTGLLAIKQNANNSNISIKCESVSNSSIYATTSITVTYYVKMQSVLIRRTENIANIKDMEYQFYIDAYPKESTNTAVIWSIDDGSDYASIDENTGLLTINEGVEGKYVTIRCTSVEDETVTSTYKSQVTYFYNVKLKSLGISGYDSVKGTQVQFYPIYNPENTTQTSVYWDILSGGEYAKVTTDNGLVTINKTYKNNGIDEFVYNKEIQLMCKSYANPLISYTKAIRVTYYINISGLKINKINDSNSFSGTTVILTVSYTPENTTQKSVIWAIKSGKEYATINNITGELTVLNTARNSTVEVVATSNSDTNIYDTMSISCTYFVPITSISISNTDIEIVNYEYMFTAILQPENTTSTVAWSIIKGETFASIDSETGKMTISDKASSNDVTVKCVSINNQEICATKDVKVTYFKELEKLEINGASNFSGSSVQYNVKFTPEDTSQKTVEWSITQDNDYAEIDSNGLLTIKKGANNNSIIITCTSTNNPKNIYATLPVTISYNYSLNTLDKPS